MVLSLHLAALAALTTLPYGSLAAGSPSNALEQCTNCGPIYKAIAKCEKITRPGGIGDEIKNCICVPNSDPNGWYSYLDSCQECLSQQQSSGNSRFFDNLATMITQLLTSCTEPGGNVLSDGQSVCATNAMWSLCASLQDGSSSGALSWASFEKFSDASQNSNATQLLQLDVSGSGGSGGSGTTSGSAKSTTVSSTTAAATGSSTDSTSSATTDSSSGVTAAPSSTPTNSTNSGSAASTKSAAPSSSSSAAGLSYRPQDGYVLGMLAAVGLVGSLM